MAYKTILVHAEDDPAADSRLDVAFTLARMFGATAFGVAAETWYPIAALPEYGYVPGDVMEGLERESLQRLEAAQARFRDRAKAAELDAIWLSELDYPRDALIRHARAADLIVASRLSPTSGEGRAARPGDLVMGAGLPVLIAAEGRSSITAEHVVVGWKNTRETRRAITDAMPFLTRASGVTLAQAAREDETGTARAELEAAAGRLTRQGVQVSVEVLADRPHVCEALESLAARRGADLIVLGGYGHARWREIVFGGVTQGFLERGAVHVLLSH